MSITRTDILVEARTWLRTKYEHQGRIKGLSVDCVGFIFGVAINTGAIPADSEIPHNYEQGGDGFTMEALLNHYLNKLNAWTDARTGDVLVMAYSPAIPQHCMIVTSHIDDEITVIEAGRDSVVEHRIDDSTKRRLHSAYMVRGIVD